MIFAYLNLPKFPDVMVNDCLKNIDIIDNDPVLYETVNKSRGPSNYGTWVTKEADTWLTTNIAKAYFDPVPTEMHLNLLNVTFYTKNPNKPHLNGQQGPHKDIGRIWALNYYFTLGGEEVKTKWYDDEKNTLKTVYIEPFRWCILRVDRLHSVQGIRIGQLRTFLSMSINKNEDYILEKLGNVIEKDTVVSL